MGVIAALHFFDFVSSLVFVSCHSNNFLEGQKTVSPLETRVWDRYCDGLCGSLLCSPCDKVKGVFVNSWFPTVTFCLHIRIFFFGGRGGLQNFCFAGF